MNIVLSNMPLLMAPGGAGGGQSGPASILPTLITFGLVFLIFYFLIIRPQNKKQKQQKEMLASLQKGDKIVTIGGIRGVITSLKEESLVVKVDNDVTMEFSRNAVSSVLEKKGSSKKKSEGKQQKQIDSDSDEASEEEDSDESEDQESSKEQPER